MGTVVGGIFGVRLPGYQAEKFRHLNQIDTFLADEEESR